MVNKKRKERKTMKKFLSVLLSVCLLSISLVSVSAESSLDTINAKSFTSNDRFYFG